MVYNQDRELIMNPANVTAKRVYIDYEEWKGFRREYFERNSNKRKREVYMKPLLAYIDEVCGFSNKVAGLPIDPEVEYHTQLMAHRMIMHIKDKGF